jgi:hypothetical protein
VEAVWYCNRPVIVADIWGMAKELDICIISAFIAQKKNISVLNSYL